MTPTVPGLGEESSQAGKERRTGPSDCLELRLEVDRPDTSWLAPSPSLRWGPCPSWDQSGEWGWVWGQPLDREAKKKKKSHF